MKKIMFTILAGLILNSCSTIPSKKYEVTKPFTIYLIDKKMLHKETKFDRNVLRKLGGYCYPDKREVYVPFSGEVDVNGNRLPDFEVLGHEIWHLKELGYKFHYDVDWDGLEKISDEIRLEVSDTLDMGVKIK